jgi:hypothetical protein
MSYPLRNCGEKSCLVCTPRPKTEVTLVCTCAHRTGGYLSGNKAICSYCGKPYPATKGWCPTDVGCVYLSSPYTHPDREVRAERFRLVLGATARLMRLGYQVFSPIIHAHPLHAREGIEGDWDYWRTIDFDFLKRMDTVVVLQIPGWADSVGVGEEIAYAISLGKRVGYLNINDNMPGTSVAAPGGLEIKITEKM